MSGQRMNTNAFMKKVRRKLTAFETAVSCHGGFDEAVQKAVSLRFELEDLIKEEHEALSKTRDERSGAV